MVCLKTFAGIFFFLISPALHWPDILGKTHQLSGVIIAGETHHSRWLISDLISIQLLGGGEGSNSKVFHWKEGRDGKVNEPQLNQICRNGEPQRRKGLLISHPTVQRQPFHSGKTHQGCTLFQSHCNEDDTGQDFLKILILKNHADKDAPIPITLQWRRYRAIVK